MLICRIYTDLDLILQCLLLGLLPHQRALFDRPSIILYGAVLCTSTFACSLRDRGTVLGSQLCYPIIEHTCTTGRKTLNVEEVTVGKARISLHKDGTVQDFSPADL